MSKNMSSLLTTTMYAKLSHNVLFLMPDYNVSLYRFQSESCRGHFNSITKDLCTPRMMAHKLRRLPPLNRLTSFCVCVFECFGIVATSSGFIFRQIPFFREPIAGLSLTHDNNVLWMDSVCVCVMICVISLYMCVCGSSLFIHLQFDCPLSKHLLNVKWVLFIVAPFCVRLCATWDCRSTMFPLMVVCLDVVFVVVGMEKQPHLRWSQYPIWSHIRRQLWTDTSQHIDGSQREYSNTARSSVLFHKNS